MYRITYSASDIYIDDDSVEHAINSVKHFQLHEFSIVLMSFIICVCLRVP